MDDTRQMMKYFDPSLGVPLLEKDYGGNCYIYDSDNIEDPFHNLWDKMDIFVFAHLCGWWIKVCSISA